MSFSKIAVNRPVSTIMLMLIIVVLGIVSFSRLALDLYPKVELPMAVVIIQYPNASSEEVETMVTNIVEKRVSTVQNLSQMTSISTDGTCIIMTEFVSGTDMNFAGLHLRESIDIVSRFLPDTASKPMIIPMNPNLLPISTIYVSSDLPLTELQNMVSDEITPQLTRAEGVASVVAFGGRGREVHVELNQERLIGYGLTLSQISQMLSAENISLPSGSVVRGERKLIVRTLSELGSVSELREIPILLPTREVIYLRDLGDIDERVKDASTIGRIDGKNAIGISITKQTISNTVMVSREVRKTMERLETAYPEIKFTIAMDQADFINESIANVAETALLGCLLAIIVTFLFLRNVASTMIIAVSIPTSIIATFILMYFTDLTMNILSLSGLAVGIGMLVDDSIVVMENVYRRRNEGLPAKDSSIIGTKEVTMPVVAATLTKIAVFLPIVFVEGTASMIFKEFSFTISFSLICSLLVALTVVPMLCSRLLNIQNISDFMLIGKRKVGVPLLPAFDKGIRGLTEAYTGFLRYALSHRKSVIASAIALLIMSTALIGVVGGVLMPTTDEGSLNISVSMPYGTAVTDTDRTVRQIEDYITAKVPELVTYNTQIGSGGIFSMLGVGSSNTATISVDLRDKNLRTRSTDDVVKQISDDLSGIVGAEINVTATATVSFNANTNPISISVKGDDLSVLRRVSGEITDIVKGVPGAINVSNSLGEGNPEVQVHLDRQKAAIYGVTAYQLAHALNNSLSGLKSTVLKSNGVETDIVLSINEVFSESIDNMMQISIAAPTGQRVTVGEIADVVYDNSPISIQRQDQVRMAVVSSNLSGRDLQSVSNDIEAALQMYTMPKGYTWSMGGDAQEMADSFVSLFYALLLALLLIYMILATQFESLVQPFIIMLSIPFALTGAFIGLFLTNTPLSLVAFLGIIMLSGIVVNNSILLIDFINQNKVVYDDREEAIVNAGRYRLRPILMTSLTTCLALIPLSLGLGSGGELQAPMGITVIGGLIFSTVITLVIVPVIYTIVDDRSGRFRAGRERKRQVKIAKLRAAGMYME